MWQEIKEEVIYMGLVYFILWGIPTIAIAAVIIFVIHAIVAMLGCG